MRIDAHVHLWGTARGFVNGRPVRPLGGGRVDFGGELRQMTPPELYDGRCPVEALLANLDFAGVSAAVVTQEYIDGNQDEYLILSKQKAPDRLRICALYEEAPLGDLSAFDGVKVCAARLRDPVLRHHREPFRRAAEAGKFLAVELAPGAGQTDDLRALAREFPALRIAVGHFGMANRPGWEAQLRLAEEPNVVLESGGLTWLYHDEGYPFPSAAAAIRTAADRVGIEKLLFGSDYPRTMTAVTYRMAWDFLDRSALLTPAECAAFYGENARKFFGFPERTDPDFIKTMAED